MISALNHLRPLNGSRYWLITILVITFLSACKVTKPIVANDQSVIGTQEQGKATGVIDTLAWDIISEAKKPPIRTGSMSSSTRLESSESDQGVKKQVYNVSIFLPLRSTTNSVNDLNTRFINYYGGALMALRQLESQGINLNVDVFDTNREATTFNNQLQSFENKNADLIIGPYDKDLLVKAAEYGKKNEVVVVSPWQSRSGIAKENPYYIQLRPSLANYYRKIMSHAKNEFNDAQIILIGGEKDSRKLTQFQYVNKELGNYRGKLKEYVMNNDSLFMAESVFGDLFYDNQPKVFIFGNTSPTDDDFLYQCLRRINIEKGECQVTVYGMPVMLDSDKIKNEFNQNVGLRVCRAKFVDRSSQPVKEFERNYYRDYGEIPSDDACEGYDVTMYLGQALDKYGTGFQYNLYKELDTYLQAKYAVDKKTKSSVERENAIEYFENRNLDIIEYRDFRFQRVGR